MSKTTLEISARLREWGLDRFRTVGGFADALGVAQPQLSNYLNGRRTPGNAMQARLRDLGCDIEWLMTGKTSQTKKELAQFVRDHPGSHIPENLPEKTRRQIKLLIEELSKLDETEVEKARAIIHTIFNTKKRK